MADEANVGGGSMSEHTPGPWFVVNRGTSDEPMISVCAARIAGQPPRHEVAICATGDSPQAMEDANARLIAAAPDLLEACATVWCRLADTEDNELRLIANECRAAIAKATGQAADYDG